MAEVVKERAVCEAAVLINSVDKVKNFVAVISRYEAEMELISGRYVVDARSIMSILCTKLSEPLVLRIHGGRAEAEEILAAIETYVLHTARCAD
ncbi:MAG: HPr family phosphocarrier protein [Lachnospiraceae bacterium]|nr:HPr family phosphocarrier protein [Lachnospiraceae bacterium]